MSNNNLGLNSGFNVRKLPGHKRATTEDIVIDVAVHLILACLCVATIYPFLNTLAYSFNDAIDSVRGGIYVWPRAFTLRNYEIILVGNPLIARAIFNSATRALAGGFLSVFACLCVSYVFSRREFIMRKAFTPFLVFTMYFSGGLIPSFILVRNLGLINNYLVYLLPTMMSAYNVMVMRSFIEGLPDSLVEAARIDGASEYRILFQIVFPLSLPAVATIALFVVVFQWNSWFDTMLYNSSEPKLTTLQFELQKLLTSAQNLTSADSVDAALSAGEGARAAVTPTSIRTAMTIIAVVPILFVYPFLQKYFVKGLTIGGVKG
ncbi:MAG: carbohydrate ABC transporter permease [Oscillospiraceae bacterium]|nr:carbohydrate ABC transporter permease [Oscillospiraceae bacterium]